VVIVAVIQCNALETRIAASGYTFSPCPISSSWGVSLVVPVTAADASDEPDDEAGDEHHTHHDQHDDHPCLQAEAAVVEQLATALVVVECGGVVACNKELG